MSKSNLSTWKYSRNSYAIAMHEGNELEISNIYISNGLDLGLDLPDQQITREISKLLNGNPLQFPAGMFIEDDDTVQVLTQKISMLSQYYSEYLYFWIENHEKSSNMQFDLIYNIDSTTSRKFNYSVIPSATFNERINSPLEWQDGKRVTTVKFENSFLSSFEYLNTENVIPLQVNIIHCMPLNSYIAFTKIKDASRLFYNAKTYFPEITSDGNLLSEIIRGAGKIKYHSDELSYRQIVANLTLSNAAVRAIQSPSLNNELLNVKDLDFYDCNILEAVIHINYKEHNDNFVDLEKVFRMFPISSEVPFSRLKSEKDTNYMIFKPSTDVKSEHYIDKHVVQDWIDPKLNKFLTVHEVYSVSSLNYSRTIGRGLSFKIFNYRHEDSDDFAKKYMTLNIYKDGKIELKCFWDEQFGTPLNPGGNLTHLIEAINKVRDFINELNLLNYSVPGVDKTKSKITLPDDKPFNIDSNCRIAFLNTISVFDFKDNLNYVEFTKYLDNFKNYVHIVTRVIDEEIDTKSMELRYKRLHNYIQLKSINRFIKNYKSEHADNDAETKADMKMLLSLTFSLSKEETDEAILEYETQFENKKKRQRRTASKDDISMILDRDSSTQSGVDIKIIKRNPGNMADNTYKCLILGISYEVLGFVYHFLKHALFYFKHNKELTLKKFPREENYLNKLKALKAKGTGSLAQGNETIVEKTEVKVYKTTTAPKAVGAKKAPMKALVVDFSDEEDQGQDNDKDKDEDQEEDKQLKTKQLKKIFQEAEPEKIKKTVITTSVVSLLQLLQDNVKEAYSPNVEMLSKQAYSTACQHSEGRQPLVIPVSLKDSLAEYLKKKIIQLKDQIAKDDSVELRKTLYEYLIHNITINRGVTYKPHSASQAFFYFCPLSWNLAAFTTPDQAFPKYTMTPTASKFIYLANQSKFITSRRGKDWDTVLEKMITEDEDTLVTPHKSYPLFFAHTDKYSACQICCYAKPGKKDIQSKCLNAGSSAVTLKPEKPTLGAQLTSIGYVKAEGKFVEENRFAFIPEKLNRIFNLNDTGRVLLSGNISTGFDYYLRKGVKDSKFLSAINTIVPKVKDFIAYLSEILREDVDMFKSLKKGALNQLFKENLEQDDEFQSEAEFANSAISLQNFISYIETNTNDINEDFLWDLLSRPGVILPKPKETDLITTGGLNIIVCEVQFVSLKSTEVEKGIIKCPVGFEIDQLFSTNRPSVILYKHKDIYEIISHVQETDGQLVSKNLFEAGHPLVTEIINHITTKCTTIANVKAEQELSKHIKQAYNDSKFNQALSNFRFDDIPDLYLTLKMLKGISNLQFYLNKAGKVSSKSYTQIVDSHNKVTHLKLTGEIWIPVKPSGIFKDIPVTKFTSIKDDEFPDFKDIVKFYSQMATFENFNGYLPYAFMIDPGENLDDANDDVIIGVILANGLICYVKPLTMTNYNIENKIIAVEHFNLASSNFTINTDSLLFSQPDLWFSDYKEGDKQLTKVSTGAADMRKIYSVRSSFENESYQRLKYELSRLLADKHKKINRQLKTILSDQVLNKDFKSVTAMNAVRDTTQKILSALIADYIIVTEELTSDQLNAIEDSVGPLNKSVEDLTDDDIDTTNRYKYNYKYNYNTPSIRYECSNRQLDKYRDPSDIHCQDNKLFISSINIITGATNNFNNYMARITEEIIRIPLKRKEVLDGQMNNVLTGINVLPVNAHLLGSSNIVDDFKEMYSATVNYKQRMLSHYDVVNPENYTENEYNEDKKRQLALDQRCIGRYVNLPPYWIDKFQSINWKIYDIKGPTICVYNELNNIISKFSNTIVNCRDKIATMIENNEIERHNDREGWQLALAYYSHLWREDYKTINTKQEMVETIRNNPQRHRLSELDLSLISRAYNIKFIIISAPNPINKTGIICLNTTQTTSDNIIVLYLQGLKDFSVVKKINEALSLDQAVFKITDLPDVLSKDWIHNCIRDSLPQIDLKNMLYQDAPVTFIDDKGDKVHATVEGSILKDPIKPKLKVTLIKKPLLAPITVEKVEVLTKKIEEQITTLIHKEKPKLLLLNFKPKAAAAAGLKLTEPEPVVPVTFNVNVKAKDKPLQKIQLKLKPTDDKTPIVKPKPQIQIQTQTQPEIQPEIQPQTQTQIQIQTQPEIQTQIHFGTQIQTQPETQIQIGTQIQTQPEIQTQTQIQPPKPKIFLGKKK